jgi:hypothetical protein
MISPNVAVALALIACAGAILLGGIHYSSGLAEVLPRRGPQFSNDDYARYFFLDNVVWDRTMPHAARRHYMVFLIYACIASACMLGVALLQSAWFQVFMVGGLLSVCAGHTLIRWYQYRDRLYHHD